MSENILPDDCKPQADEYLPVGDRWLEKTPCSSCFGNGYHLSLLEQECPDCKGSGFVFSSKNDANLCEKCKGFRMINIESKRACESCGGKGFFPKILQNFEAVAECPVCNGSGEIDEEYEEEDEDESEECDCCEGCGFESKKKIYTFEEWYKVSKDYKPNDDMLLPSELSAYRTDTNHEVEIINCEWCERNYNNHSLSIEKIKKMNNECQYCGGENKVVQLSFPCASCNGNGYLPTIVRKVSHNQCDCCKGEGEILHTETREV